jgi:hypothetical protein
MARFARAGSVEQAFAPDGLRPQVKVAMYALEIQDAGLTLVGEAGLLAEEPGYALCERRGVAYGAEARARARLAPRQLDSRFWSVLLGDPAASADTGPGTPAALAYGQLADMLRRLARPGAELILLVPGDTAARTVGLLAGMVAAAGARAVGVLAPALLCAAPVEEPSHVRTPDAHGGPTTVYLDASLFGATASRLGGTQEVSIAAHQSGGHGLEALGARWVSHLVDAFVARTRFDPLDDAATEQALYAALPDLMQVGEGDDAPLPLALERGGRQHAIEVVRKDLAAAAAPCYTAWRQLLETAHDGRGPLHAVLPSRLGRLPGLRAALAPALAGGALETLAPGELCARALARADEIRATDGGLERLLALARPGARGRATAPPSVEPRDLRGAAPSPPTHVVHAGVAHFVRPPAFSIGSAVLAGAGLAIDAAPGIAPRHCELVRDGDTVVLRSFPGATTLVNGAPPGSDGRLARGDRLALGTSPAVELLMIALGTSDGA